jgi:hypothetical protein
MNSGILSVRKALTICLLIVPAALAIACSGSFNVTTPSNSGGPNTGIVSIGASTPREKLLEKDIGVLEDVVFALSNIKTQNDLAPAMPRLNDLLDKHKNINQEAEKLGVPTKHEKDEMFRKYGERIKTGKGKLAAEMVRVNQLPGAGDLYRRLAEFNQGF